MRRYDIVTGILLILSIIDSALAAPVRVQETREAQVDVAHISKDVSTALGKRSGEELKMSADYLKTLIEPVKPSDAHASSSSAPPPSPESSTANPGLLMEPSLPTGPIQGLWGDQYNPAWDDISSSKSYDSSLEPMHSPTASGYVSSSGSTEMQVNPARPGPLTGTEPEMDWDYWDRVVNGLPPKEVEQIHEAPSTGTEPEMDWDYWNRVVNGLPPKEVEQVHEAPSTGTVPDIDWPYMTNRMALSPLMASLKLSTKHPWFDSPHDYNPPPSPNAASQTEVYSYPHLELTALPPSRGALLQAVPEHGELEFPPTPDSGSPKVLGNELALPGLESPKASENEVLLPPDPDLGPLPEEPYHDVIPEPPQSPNIELHPDHPPLTTLSQAVNPGDLHSALKYVEKGKGKAESSRFPDTAGDLGM